MQPYPDKFLMQGLRKKQKLCCQYFYREYFPMVLSYVERNKGSRSDAEDVFQDALTILYLRLREGKLKLKCSLKTYFFSICRHVWLKRLCRRNRELLSENMEAHEEPASYAVQDPYINEEKLEMNRLLQEHFLSIPEDCQKLLSMYLRKIPLKEIAEYMGLKSEDYAKSRKYLCKNMLRKRILSDPACKLLLKND